MSVLHVFAQAYVGDDEQRRQFFFQEPHGLLHDSILGIRAGSFRVFFVGNAEKQNRRDPERVRANGLAQQFIGRKLEHAGQGGDRAAEFPSGPNEQRQHELRRSQMGFGHELPQRCRLTQPARAISRKLSDGLQAHEPILVSKREEQSRKWQ